jgi:hypothetical protein
MEWRRGRGRVLYQFLKLSDTFVKLEEYQEGRLGLHYLRGRPKVSSVSVSYSKTFLVTLVGKTSNIICSAVLATLERKS